MVLNSEVWQGHFAEGLVWAMACAAGLNPGKRALDVDGVDIQISFPGPLGTRRYPQIEAQIKSCSNPRYVNSCLAYAIPIKNYNDLVGEVGIDFPVRRYLFLVHTPKDKSDYTQSTEQWSKFHHAIYWLDLMALPAVDPAGQGNKTVHVPTENLLTTEKLLGLVRGEIAKEADQK